MRSGPPSNFGRRSCADGASAMEQIGSTTGTNWANTGGLQVKIITRSTLYVKQVNKRYSQTLPKTVMLPFSFAKERSWQLREIGNRTTLEVELDPSDHVFRRYHV